MPYGIGGSIAEGLRSGFQLGLESDAAKQHRYEFEREQSARDEAQARLAKQEEDRYGRLADATRVQAVEARLEALNKQADDIATKQGPQYIPDWMHTERGQLAAQLADMRSQITTSGRLTPPAGAITAPRPNVARAEPSAAAPTPTAPISGAPISAPPAPTGPLTGAGPGPQSGPAGMPAPVDALGAAPDGGQAPQPGIAGGAPPAAAVASPTTSARTPAQAFITSADQQSQDLASRLSTGQVSLSDVKPGDFALMMASATKRDPRELDQVRQHIDDFQSGMQTGNNGLMLQGVNGIFGPQIAQGVGTPSAYGGTITGKSVIGLDPALSANGAMHADKVIPRLQVTTDLNGPDGQPLSYHAPMTQDRSTDPNDPVTAVPMADAVNHIGALSALVSAASHPDAQALIAKGATDPRVQQYIDYYKNSAAPANPALVKENQISAYMKAAGVDRDTATQRMIDLGVLPRPPQIKGSIAQMMDAAQQLVDTHAAPDIPTAMGMVQHMNRPSKYGIGGAGTTGGGDAAAVAGAQAKSGGLKPETVDFYATQSIAGDNSWQVGLGRGKVGQALIAAVKDRIPEKAAELGLSPQDVGSNKAQNAALTKTLADRTKYVTAVNQLQGTLTAQANLVKSLLAKGGATEGGPLFNAPYNKIREALGSVDAHNLDVALTGLAREHQRVIVSPLSNGQLAVSAQATGDKLANLNLSPSQILGTIDTMETEARNAREQGQTTLDSVKSQLSGLGKGAAAPAAAGGKLVYDPTTGTFH